MRELRFTGLSPDGRTLLAIDPTGEQFSIPVDEIIAAAVRDRPRSSAAEVTPGRDLRPAEIQSEIRAGATPEQLAEITGMDVDRLERFAAPVLQERAWIAQRASRVLVAGGVSPRSLLECVLAYAERSGHPVEAADLIWDAWRRDNGRWSVAVEMAGEEAVWLFDPDVSSLAPDDDRAREIHGLGRAPAVGPAPDPRPRGVTPARERAAPSREDTMPLERSRPGSPNHPTRRADDTAPQPATRTPDSTGTARPGPRPAQDRPTAPIRSTAPERPTPARDGPTEVIPPVRPGARRRRATVPSWDEILFGARQED